MIRKMILLGALLILLLLPAAALAGGWVVISLDTLPDQIHAGQPVTLSFMVRQHGRTPIDGVEPKLTATNRTTGQQIQVAAEPMKELGRFMVTIDFPDEGQWEWSISAEPFPQTATFAPLTVLPAEQPAGSAQQIEPAAFGWQVLARWLGLALVVAAAAFLALDRWRGRAGAGAAIENRQ